MTLLFGQMANDNRPIDFLLRFALSRLLATVLLKVNAECSGGAIIGIKA